MISTAVADLFPGYFALVMATGIVSIGAFLLGMTVIAWVLVWINVAAYAMLLILLAARLVFFFPRIKADIANSARGPGFFTVVAGTCVLGSQLLIIGDYRSAAWPLWVFGFVLWVLIMYSFFTVMTVKEDKPPLESGINGAWLIAVVSTQSVAVLGTLLSVDSASGETILFLMFCMFLVGCMLYMLLISLIFYRFTFFELTTSTLTPPYWINMGAVAITTLAGARLIIAAPGSEIIRDFLPFLKGFTLFFWAGGTWWIPLLIILGVWRHIYKRFPLRYDPQYWGMVFPLGMYTVCTFQLSKAIGFEPLMAIPTFFIYIALAAWLAASIGFFYSLFIRKDL